MSWRDNVPKPSNRRNPSQDTRVNYTNPLVGRMERGLLLTINQQGPTERWHFLANPSVISVGYQVAEGLNFMDPATYNPNFFPMIGDGFQNISFAVMLDRTYEVHYGSLPSGVLSDIAQLERLGGPNEVQTSEFESKDEYAVAGHLQGVLARKPIRAIFGGRYADNATNRGSVGTGGTALTFDGYITSLSVAYTSFSRNMVPMRAAVTISMHSIGTQSNSDGGGMGGTVPKNPRKSGARLSADAAERAAEGPGAKPLDQGDRFDYEVDAQGAP